MYLYVETDRYQIRNIFHTLSQQNAVSVRDEASEKQIHPRRKLNKLNLLTFFPVPCVAISSFWKPSWREEAERRPCQLLAPCIVSFLPCQILIEKHFFYTRSSSRDVCVRTKQLCLHLKKKIKKFVAVRTL